MLHKSASFCRIPTATPENLAQHIPDYLSPFSSGTKSQSGSVWLKPKHASFRSFPVHRCRLAKYITRLKLERSYQFFTKAFSIFSVLRVFKSAILLGTSPQSGPPKGERRGTKRGFLPYPTWMDLHGSGSMTHASQEAQTIISLPIALRSTPAENVHFDQARWDHSKMSQISPKPMNLGSIKALQ